MKLEITRFAALFPYGYFVQWSMSSIPPEESGTFAFTLERSGGPNGPWTKILDANDQYAFSDRFDAIESTADELQPNSLRLYQEVYYRVTCTTPTGKVLTDVEETGSHAPSRKMMQYLRKGQRDFRLTLKYNGTPVALLKKRRWGVRCPKCFDKGTKEVARPNCPVCWSTGFVGGYWEPFYTKARRNVSSNTSTITPAQKSDANDASFWLPDYPSLERDDLIVSFSDQRRFRVDVSIETNIQLNTVHQEVTALQLPNDHPMLRYPFNFDSFPPVYGEVRP